MIQPTEAERHAPERPQRGGGANGATQFVTVSGRVIDLYAPKAEDICFNDIAEQLAKEARYNGATPGAIYFVAQHLCLGADFLIRASKPAAAHFLLHDAPEAYLKDDTTPKKRALDRVASEFGNASDAITKAVASLTDRFDRVIHAAAALPWPMRDDMEHLVETVDRAMLVTEWLQLRPAHPLPDIYRAIDPIPIAIEPWPWERAEFEFSARMQQLLPVFRGSAA